MLRRLLSVIVVLGFVGILFAQEVAYRHITAIESASADTLQQAKKSKTPQGGLRKKSSCTDVVILRL